jgi:hypothetical protein
MRKKRKHLVSVLSQSESDQQRSTLEMWQQQLRSLRNKRNSADEQTEIIKSDNKDNSIYPFLP